MQSNHFKVKNYQALIIKVKQIGVDLQALRKAMIGFWSDFDVDFD